MVVSLLDIRGLRILAFVLVIYFVIAILLLHTHVEQLDDEEINLLAKSNDWKGIRLKHVVHKAVNAVKGDVEQALLQIKNQNKALRRKSHHQALNMNRLAFERQFPPDDLERTKQRIQSLSKPQPKTHASDLTYDIFNCPATPPPNYPYEWSLLYNVLKDWNPDDTQIPSTIYQAVCVFDWEKDQAKAEAYRQAEMPFVLQNHPDVIRTAERWNHPNYLENLIGNGKQRNEHSTSNHFMFWKLPRNPRNKNKLLDWKPPTEIIQDLSYPEWLQRAREMETTPNQANQEHWYFRLNGDYDGPNQYLYDEMPVFVPVESTMFMVEPEDHRGINCRFGMAGVIAESHFDISRNWILVLGGQRRYILQHPRQCANVELYPKSHPSGRHSAVDWSHPPFEDKDRPFAQATANEVVLQPGDALYLPTSWLHFIVSLNTNYQCNGRSGITSENHHHLIDCGFPPPDAMP